MVNETLRLFAAIAAAAATIWYAQRHLPLAETAVGLAGPIAAGAAVAFAVVLTVDFVTDRRS